MYARTLRIQMTDAEKILWEALRGRRCAGIKFRRQAPIKHFIVDFLSLEHSLIIEVDGPIHNQQKEYDRDREKVLQERGYTILRFTNKEIVERLDTVLEIIRLACARL